MHHCFGPLERSGCLLIRLDEAVDGLAKLTDRCATQISQGLAAQNAEPDLHHVEKGVKRRQFAGVFQKASSGEFVGDLRDLSRDF